MKWKNYPINEVSVSSKKYPKLLKKIQKPPKKLYYRGDLKVLNKKGIAIVGSRRMSRYGKSAVDQFVSEFVSNQAVTISGFMYGVDTEVHKKTLEYGGITVGVFGCGLDVVYPPENEKLYGQILESGGLVISEYTPEAKPHLWKFPQRNRIVAGLASLGVLVIEAGGKSGSLITAGIAAEQGKKVYALPGPITSPISIGTNMLIKTGKANLATEPGDILGKRQKKKESKKISALSPLEKKIWKALEIEPLNTDEIAAEVGTSIIKVATTLSVMGIKGWISESGGKFHPTSL